MSLFNYLKTLLFPTASARLNRAISGFDKAIAQLERAADECARESLIHQEALAQIQKLQAQAAADSFKAANVATKLKALVA